MQQSEIIALLDNAIRLSKTALSNKELQSDVFIELEQERQSILATIKRLQLPTEPKIIDRLQLLLGLNQKILAYSIELQENLQKNLKNNRHQRTVSDAYKKL